MKKVFLGVLGVAFAITVYFGGSNQPVVQDQMPPTSAPLYYTVN